MKQAIRIAFVFLFLCSNVLDIQGQTADKANESVIDSLKNQPSFSIYGDNYFVTGTQIGTTPTPITSDAKFQLGFKQYLVGFEKFYNTFLFVTYRQLSFWDIYQESFPFRANNYNPSFVLGKMLIKNGKPMGRMQLAFEHESNGLGGQVSRSWNFISFRYTTRLSDQWYGSIKGWVPVSSMSDNKDLMDYKSYFECAVAYYPMERLILESEFRRSFTPEWYGKIMLSASYRISKTRNQFIFLQYYNGYAESLTNYDRRVNMIRVGINFKDLSWLSLQ